MKAHSNRLLMVEPISRYHLLRPLAIVNAIVNRRTNISNGLPSHAGGPGYKGSVTTLSTDCPIESIGADGTAAVASDDDDGDGDGDPDSDRATHALQKTAFIKTRQTALDQKRIPVSNRILRMAELKVRIGLSRSTIYEAINQGNFPASISLGARAVGWLESDVDKWLENRINASREV